MQVVCLDGTVIHCDKFRAIDAGVLTFEGAAGGEDEEEAIGFVPHEELRYVLPEDVQPGTPVGAQQQATPAPQGTGQWVQGQPAQQQEHQQPQS